MDPADGGASPSTPEPARLILLGYWDGPETQPGWPDPTAFVDRTWDEFDRGWLAHYLDRGFVVRACMGYSRCRMCGVNNGTLELSDGTFVWPEGLAHYVTEHGVRPPEEFVQHAFARVERLEAAARDVEWWRAQPHDTTRIR